MALTKTGYKVSLCLEPTVECALGSNQADLDFVLVASIQCCLVQGFDGTGTACR